MGWRLQGCCKECLEREEGCAALLRATRLEQTCCELSTQARECTPSQVTSHDLGHSQAAYILRP